MTIPPLHWLADYFPADATRTRGTKGKQHLDIPQPEPTIGATPRGGANMPLPRGSARSDAPRIGEGSLPQAAATVASKIHSAVRNTGGGLNPVGQVEDATKAAFQSGQRFYDAVHNSQYGSALGEIGATAASAGLFAIPEGAGLGRNIERYAILTGENAGGRAMTAAENEARNASLHAELAQRGYNPIPVVGRYKDPNTGEVLTENSLLVPNMSERSAKLIGKRYGQNGVITQRGYHNLVDNTFHPSSGTSLTNDLPYKQLPNGKRFTLNIDWENAQQPTINALPVPKNANPEVLRVADEMRAANPAGTNLPRVKKVDPEQGRMMARLYDQLPTNDPQAKAAYDALNNEVAAQYDALQKAGFKFQFTNEDPYKNSNEMMNDVRQNRTLKVFKTPSDNFHPYMTPEQNDKFRAVHDLLAHAGEGHQFGPTGEENAYRVHASTLSPLAQRALATETRGQNSWVNFGPFANLAAKDRPFATQKAALFPESYLGDYSTMPQPIDSRTTEALDKLDAFSHSLRTPAEPTPVVPQQPTSLDDVLSQLDQHTARIYEANGRINAPSVITQPNSGDVFDVSRLGTDLPPGVNTQRPPVKYPKRADLSMLDPVKRNVRTKYTPAVMRALKDNPEAAGWYDTTQPRDAFADLMPNGANDWRQFMLFNGPTSIGTKVPDNIRQASMMYYLWKNAQNDPAKLDAFLNDLKSGSLELPAGYSNRRQKSVNAGIARILENGNLDPFTTPKTFRYANQLGGDMWGGTALDMHVGRTTGRPGFVLDKNGVRVPEVGFPTPSYGDNQLVTSSPTNTHYPVIEDQLVRQAQNLGLAPTQYQALGWVGNGAATNVSDTRPWLGIFNQKLRDTAKKYGFNSPLDAFTAFAQGQTPLWAMLPAAGLGGGLLYDNRQNAGPSY